MAHLKGILVSTIVLKFSYFEKIYLQINDIDSMSFKSWFNHIIPNDWFIDFNIMSILKDYFMPSRRYPAKTITDADYADGIALLANTPNQAETLLHSLERAAASNGLHVNAHKTEYMCYNQTGDISTLDGTLLKLVDKFTYLRSSV